MPFGCVPESRRRTGLGSLGDKVRASTSQASRFWSSPLDLVCLFPAVGGCCRHGSAVEGAGVCDTRVGKQAGPQSGWAGARLNPRGGCRRQNGGDNGGEPLEAEEAWLILASLGSPRPGPRQDLTSGEEPEACSCSSHRQGVSTTGGSNALERRRHIAGGDTARQPTRPAFPRFWPRNLAHQVTEGSWRHSAPLARRGNLSSAASPRRCRSQLRSQEGPAFGSVLRGHAPVHVPGLWNRGRKISSRRDVFFADMQEGASSGLFTEMRRCTLWNSACVRGPGKNHVWPGVLCSIEKKIGIESCQLPNQLLHAMR
jgi:hypothetical protein